MKCSLLSRYAVVALFVEVNSIFLHTRQLLNIMGMSKQEPKYRLNSMLNIGTFVVFRIAVLGWMTRWLVIHKDDLTLPVYTLGSVGKPCFLPSSYHQDNFFFSYLILVVDAKLDPFDKLEKKK